MDPQCQVTRLTTWGAADSSLCCGCTSILLSAPLPRASSSSSSSSSSSPQSSLSGAGCMTAFLGCSSACRKSMAAKTNVLLKCWCIIYLVYYIPGVLYTCRPKVDQDSKPAPSLILSHPGFQPTLEMVSLVAACPKVVQDSNLPLVCFRVYPKGGVTC